MCIFQESDLKFEFDAAIWDCKNIVFKYDEDATYTRMKNVVPETKAVDFIAKNQKGVWHLIEVKNFRGHRIENKARLNTGELWIEIAKKIRDTLACLFATALKEGASHNFYDYVQAMLSANEDGKTHIWLWLEEDNHAPPRAKSTDDAKVKHKAQLDALRNKIRPWLSNKNADIQIYSTKNPPDTTLGLKVSFLPNTANT